MHKHILTGSFTSNQCNHPYLCVPIITTTTISYIEYEMRWLGCWQYSANDNHIITSCMVLYVRSIIHHRKHTHSLTHMDDGRSSNSATTKYKWIVFGMNSNKTISNSLSRIRHWHSAFKRTKLCGSRCFFTWMSFPHDFPIFEVLGCAHWAHGMAWRMRM